MLSAEFRLFEIVLKIHYIHPRTFLQRKGENLPATKSKSLPLKGDLEGCFSSYLLKPNSLLCTLNSTFYISQPLLYLRYKFCAQLRKIHSVIAAAIECVRKNSKLYTLNSTFLFRISNFQLSALPSIQILRTTTQNSLSHRRCH